MKILAIDVGRNMGLCLYDTEKEKDARFSKHIHRYEFLSLMKFFEVLASFTSGGKCVPDLVITARPPIRPQVIAFQSKMIAIVELFAERFGISFMEIYDNEAKKLVLGKGNADKERVKEWVNEFGLLDRVKDKILEERKRDGSRKKVVKLDDIADAVMFAEYAKKYLKDQDAKS